MDFWARWRRLSNWLSGVLVAVFGLIAIIGGVQLWRADGPIAVVVAFVSVGALMLLAIWRWRA